MDDIQQQHRSFASAHENIDDHPDQGVGNLKSVQYVVLVCFGYNNTINSYTQ